MQKTAGLARWLFHTYIDIGTDRMKTKERSREAIKGSGEEK